MTCYPLPRSCWPDPRRPPPLHTEQLTALRPGRRQRDRRRPRDRSAAVRSRERNHSNASCEGSLIEPTSPKDPTSGAPQERALRDRLGVNHNHAPCFQHRFAAVAGRRVDDHSRANPMIAHVPATEMPTRRGRTASRCALPAVCRRELFAEDSRCALLWIAWSRTNSSISCRRRPDPT